MARAHELSERYRVRGARFSLADVDPADSAGLERDSAEQRLAEQVERLGVLQQRLYAGDEWAVLLVLQGMDASGKDGVVKHVLAEVDPAGSHVTPFKVPSVEELDHDFLWRAVRALPERGRIGVFNRSYYEEVVTVRVSPEYLAKQRLPKRLVTRRIWDERMEDIVDFERHLVRSGTVVLKFFLHVSKDEQKQRFLERLERPDKNWKFREDDVRVRERWDEYQDCWSTAIARTSTKHAPWFAVPADRKWFTRLVVADAVVQALEKLEHDFPRPVGERRRELERARKLLLAEPPSRRPRRKS